MKLLFTNDWLRQGIAADPDSDPEAGPSITGTAEANVATIGEQKAVRLRIALGVLVRQLRMKEGLTLAQLAERAQVLEDQLRQVEHDPHYTASPRLIFQLSNYFKVSLVMLSQLSGATHTVERTVYNAALKYAACSDDVSTLTAEERVALDGFVALLNERAKGGP